MSEQRRRPQTHARAEGSTSAVAHAQHPLRRKVRLSRGEWISDPEFENSSHARTPVVWVTINQREILNCGCQTEVPLNSISHRADGSKWVSWNRSTSSALTLPELTRACTLND